MQRRARPARFMQQQRHTFHLLPPPPPSLPSLLPLLRSPPPPHITPSHRTFHHPQPCASRRLGRFHPAPRHRFNWHSRGKVCHCASGSYRSRAGVMLSQCSLISTRDPPARQGVPVYMQQKEDGVDPFPSPAWSASGRGWSAVAVTTPVRLNAHPSHPPRQLASVRSRAHLQAVCLSPLDYPFQNSEKLA
jgi:hypothetical protein